MAGRGDFDRFCDRRDGTSTGVGCVDGEMGGRGYGGDGERM